MKTRKPKSKVKKLAKTVKRAGTRFPPPKKPSTPLPEGWGYLEHFENVIGVPNA